MNECKASEMIDNKSEQLRVLFTTGTASKGHLPLELQGQLFGLLYSQLSLSRLSLQLLETLIIHQYHNIYREEGGRKGEREQNQ